MRVSESHLRHLIRLILEGRKEFHDDVKDIDFDLPFGDPLFQRPESKPLKQAARDIKRSWNANVGSRKGALGSIKGREGEFEKIAVVFPFEGAEGAVKRVSAARAKKAKALGKSKTVPADAIDRMMGAYEPVTPAEGFDDVIVFDNRATLRDLAEAADAEEAADSTGTGSR